MNFMTLEPLPSFIGAFCQVAFLNSVVFVQMDMLRVFHPISSLPESFIGNSKRFLIFFFVLSIVFPGIGSLIYVAITKVPYVRARILQYTILANMVFCALFTIWQLSYTLYILRRYLQKQLNLSAKRRKKYQLLMVFVFMLVVHDVLATVLFCIDLLFSRIRGIAVCTHFILMAIIFQKMVDVTFPKGHGNSPAVTKLNESELQVHPIMFEQNIQSPDFRISLDERSYANALERNTVLFPQLIDSQNITTSIVQGPSNPGLEKSTLSLISQ
jgi:hypothetical protein